jgi:hypothetical protein
MCYIYYGCILLISLFVMYVIVVYYFLGNVTYVSGVYYHSDTLLLIFLFYIIV